MFKQQTNKNYRVAVYCRISKEDGSGEESVSIGTQKDMLTQYVNSNGWVVAGYYVDDGYSGLNFNRPEFQRMISDIGEGKINCVITKDLSRLGRNYLDCGVYLEIFFPENNVRYIALNDNVDTINNNTIDFTPFKNILNEMYSKDISRKVKTAKRALLQQGKFLGVSAPYGYLKDIRDKNHLVIDESTAPIVKQIFDLSKQGFGISMIRQHLTKEMIVRPGVDALKKGGGYEHYFTERDEWRITWSNNSVRSILRNPVYAGHLVGYKRPIPSMKSKRRLTATPEDWVIVKNTHEAIISQQDFDLVQKLITSRRRDKNKYGYNNIFAGIIKCEDCGHAMRATSANRRKRPEIIDCVQYNCNHYTSFGKEYCTKHTIEARDLYEVVLNDINMHAKAALDNDSMLLSTIIQRLSGQQKSVIKAMDGELKKLKKRKDKVNYLFTALYEDKVFEKIDANNYEIMSIKYLQEQKDIEKRISDITEEVEKDREYKAGANEFIKLIQEYAGIKELTAPIVNSLIEKITVGEAKEVDGEIIQRVRIYYKFIGSIS